MGTKAARMNDPREADRIAVWESESALYVAALPRGPITVLEGTAVTIWIAANAGPIEDAAARVADAMGLTVDEVRAPVDQFIDRLVARGLLSRSH